MGVSKSVMVCAVLLGLLTLVPASTSTIDQQGEQDEQLLQDEQQLIDTTPSLQQIISLIDYLQNRELELLTRDKQNDMSSESIMENNNISNNRIRQLANAYDELMRQQNMAVQPSSVQQSMEKRAAKYMSLCHFKICNMGKRTGYETIPNKRANIWPLNWFNGKSRL